MEMSMAIQKPQQSAPKVFKAPLPESAPKSRSELAKVMDRQIVEHSADYEKLAR